MAGSERTSIILDKITAGVELALHRLVQKAKKEDRELVIEKDGEIVRVKARDLQ